MRKSLLQFAMIISLALLLCFVFSCQKKAENEKKKEEPIPKATSSYIDLKATVEFTGTQFVITNNDEFDWVNVKMWINSLTGWGGYKFSHDRLQAGQTYTVGAMQFVDSDYKRFNPFLEKPRSFNIRCDSVKGEGSYRGEWKQ